MLVGIHKDPYDHFSVVKKKFEKILQHNNIDTIRLEASQPDFWDIVPKLDLFIYMWYHMDSYKYIAKTILPVIENDYKIKCLPNQATCWHYDDKVKQYLMLKAHGYPVVNSWVFFDKKEALSWAKTTKYPVVFKLAGGSGSSSVILVKKESEAVTLINRMFGKGIVTSKIPSLNSLRFKQFNPAKEIKKIAKKYYNLYKGRDAYHYWQPHKNYAYFQEFLPGNDYDTRVTTIGNRGFAFRRFVRENDFRASGSDNWSLDRSKLDMEMVKIAMDISKNLGFQVMAYDFIYDQNKEPRIVEISYTYGDYPEFSTGYIDEDLKWHDGNYWTQYLELVDALNMPDLKQPYIAPDGHYSEVLNKPKTNKS